MQEIYDHNKLIDTDEVPEEYTFEYNFINTPWDDRTYKSKIGIVLLLVSIFIAIIACVINGFVLQYRGLASKSRTFNGNEINCHLVRMEDYRFVARIHSLATRELLCVGAVVSSTSVLANHICVQSGPVKLRLGSVTNHKCRNGFDVDLIEIIPHDGVVTQKLVLLTVYNRLDECSTIIPVGQSLDITSRAYIMGRPYYTGKSLSRRPVTIVSKSRCHFRSQSLTRQRDQKSIICVNDTARCPVRAGDLLIQRGYLYGLASTSIHLTDEKKLVSFADLEVIYNDIKELNANKELNKTRQNEEK